MLNPSYLIKSRHDIYYFRYPLPVSQCGVERRVSISLRTRCPREALRLAKVLEYHSANLIAKIDIERMDYLEIISILKDHYSEVLERSKARINTVGRLPKRSIEIITDELKLIDELIEDGSDDFAEMLGIEYEDSKHSLDHKLAEIMDKRGLSFEEDSNEYKNLKEAYKFVRRNYLKDVLSYNDEVLNFSLSGKQQSGAAAHLSHSNSKDRLDAVIAEYLNDIKPSIEERSLKEQEDCLRYLQDLFGSDCLIAEIDFSHAKDVKQKLQVTPSRRNVAKLTRGLPLLEQLSVAEEHGLDLLSSSSVSKYMTYFKALFEWARRNRMVSENVFDGIVVRKDKRSKKKNRRDMFSKDEIAVILKELEANESGKIKNTSQYWGALIAIYTGARRNEIGALMVDDVKQDEESGIWYFDITDEEEEGKDLKTEAARRIVPVHSKLIELGFMEFLEDAKKAVLATPLTKGMKTRLLYNFTYTKHDKWGRTLGQFMNDRLLDYLNLRIKNKKTLHSLRHSFITFLDVASVKATTIKSMVGHEQGTVTHGVYTHYGVDHLRLFKEEIEKLPY